VEAVLETAVRMGTDLVLIREPRGGKEKDSTRSLPNFRFIGGGRGSSSEVLSGHRLGVKVPGDSVERYV